MLYTNKAHTNIYPIHFLLWLLINARDSDNKVDTNENWFPYPATEDDYKINQLLPKNPYSLPILQNKKVTMITDYMNFMKFWIKKS